MARLESPLAPMCRERVSLPSHGQITRAVCGFRAEWGLTPLTTTVLSTISGNSAHRQMSGHGWVGAKPARVETTTAIRTGQFADRFHRTGPWAYQVPEICPEEEVGPVAGSILWATPGYLEEGVSIRREILLISMTFGNWKYQIWL